MYFCSHGSAAVLEEDENGKFYLGHTAIFIMVVSPAVLAHDAPARAGDVSMGVAVFPMDWIYLGLFEKLGDG